MVCNCAVKYVPFSNSSRFQCVLCVQQVSLKVRNVQVHAYLSEKLWLFGALSEGLQECPVVPVQLAADALSPAG